MRKQHTELLGGKKKVASGKLSWSRRVKKGGPEDLRGVGGNFNFRKRRKLKTSG